MKPVPAGGPPNSIWKDESPNYVVSIASQCFRDNWKGQSGSVWQIPISWHECLVSAPVSSLCHEKAGLALIMLQLKRRFSIRLWDSAVVLRAAQFVWMRQDGRLTEAPAEDTSMVVSLAVITVKCHHIWAPKKTCCHRRNTERAGLAVFLSWGSFILPDTKTFWKDREVLARKWVIWRNYERYKARILWGKKVKLNFVLPLEVYILLLLILRLLHKCGELHAQKYN